MQCDVASRDGSELTEGLGAAVTKRDDVALWGNIVLLHLWGAVGYLKPGFLPAMAGALQLVVLLAFVYQLRLKARLAACRT